MRVLPKLLVSSLFFASGSALSVVGFAQPAPDDDTPLEEPREPDPETPPDEPAPRGPEPPPPPSDPDTPPDTPDDRDATSDTPELSPPRIVSAPKATYPAGQPLMTPAPRVVLRVTIDEQGRVQQSAVLKAPGPTFATSAQQAVQAWTFEPARRNGTPIAAEVKVEVGFEAPKPATVPPGSEPARTKPAPGAIPPETPAPPSQGPLPPKAAPTPVTPPPPEPEFEATGKVEAATLRSRERGPTDFELDHELLSAAPHQDTGDMLRTVPGVYSARVEGPAVAHSIFLRGFNAEHGQDLEM